MSTSVTSSSYTRACKEVKRALGGRIQPQIGCLSRSPCHLMTLLHPPLTSLRCISAVAVGLIWWRVSTYDDNVVLNMDVSIERCRCCEHVAPLKRWLQLRFDFDSTSHSMHKATFDILLPPSKKATCRPGTPPLPQWYSIVEFNVPLDTV